MRWPWLSQGMQHGAILGAMRSHRDVLPGISHKAPGIGSRSPGWATGVAPGSRVLAVGRAVAISVSRDTLESLAVCPSYVSISRYL